VLGQGIIGIIVALAFVNFLTKRSKNAVPENLVMDETEVIIAEHKN
jgi:hypothetical protein